MGLFDRVRNLVTGHGWRDTAPAPAPAPVERRGGVAGLWDRVSGADRRREERAELETRERAAAERERAAQEREQAAAERERAAQERERQAEEKERAAAEREERERGERERATREREERERGEKERESREQAVRDHQQWKESLGIEKEVVGGRGWTMHTVRSPEEVRQLVDDAAKADKRVSLNVHDKNGWHRLFLNTGRDFPGGRGMSAGEMLDRFDKAGVPGDETDRALSGVAAGGISPVPGGGQDFDFDSPGAPIEGPEWEEEGYSGEYDGDYYDYIDVSDGGDDTDTEGYDPGSVSGYQVVVYG